MDKKKPVRFALIGYGAWGQRHAVAIERTEGAELAAIAAHSAASIAEAREAYPDVDVVADYRELLERDDVDVADIVLPNHLHTEASIAALQAGKDVLLEKPMANTSADCQRINEAAADAGRQLMLGFELRHSDLWGEAKRLIERGVVGEPRYLLIELWRRPYRRGAGGWRYDIGRVGNWILEEPVHFFDLARWYMASLGNPVSVYALGNSIQEGHPELEDNFSALLRFAGGAQAVVTHTLAAFEHHQTVKITGTKGAVWAAWSGALDRDEHPTATLKVLEDGEPREVELQRRTGELADLEDEIAMAVAVVREGAAPLADGVDGLWSVALCEAAEASIQKRREVLLADYLA